MSDALNERLNKILPKIVSDDFLSGRGLGNEIAYHIFDYPPEEELRVRDYLRTLPDHLKKAKHDLRVGHVNMFDLVLGYLKSRNLLDKALVMQREKGNEALKKALLGPLNIKNNLIPYFTKLVEPEEKDLIILTGIGSVYPMLRTSSLLWNLQPVIHRIPLVVFYPGKYDQVSLRLFGKLRLSAFFEGEVASRKSENYYKAFKLVP